MKILEKTTNKDSIVDKFASDYKAMNTLAQITASAGYEAISGAETMSLISMLIAKLKKGDITADSDEYKSIIRVLTKAKNSAEELRRKANDLSTAANDASYLVSRIRDYIGDVTDTFVSLESEGSSRITKDMLSNAQYSEDFMKDRASVNIGRQTYVKVGKNAWEHVPYGEFSYPTGTFSDDRIMDLINEFKGTVKFFDE